MSILTGNLYIDSISITFALVAILLAYLKWSFTFWARQGIYSPPPSVPFGNAGKLVLQKNCLGTEFQDVYRQIKAKGHKYGGYYFFGKPIFIPVDLDLIKLMLTKDFMHFTNHANHVDEEFEPLSGHLFSMKGGKWKNLRAKLTPTFTSGKMKMMFQTLVDCSTLLVEVMDGLAGKREPVDVREITARFTTDIISSCAFGLECNCLRNPKSEFREYGKKVFSNKFSDSLSRLMTFTSPELLRYVKLRTFRKDVVDFFTKVVSETVKYREENNVVRKDFMHLLIQLKNNVRISENDVGELNNGSKSEGTALTMNELTAQAFVFFVAGYETSSTTTTFCLYELAQNQEIQEKVRQEVNAVLDKYSGQVTYEGMMELTYMEKCIDETLRKFPPIPVHTRECTQTYNVPNSNVVLQKGTFVFISPLGIQTDPDYYPEPDKFDPERFSEENKAKRHSAAWTPFGDGPRTCIGLRFGIMQTKVGLSVLLKNYRFTLSPKTESPLRMDPTNIILSARSGIWFNVEKI